MAYTEPSGAGPELMPIKTSCPELHLLGSSLRRLIPLEAFAHCERDAKIRSAVVQAKLQQCVEAKIRAELVFPIRRIDSGTSLPWKMAVRPSI